MKHMKTILLTTSILGQQAFANCGDIRFGHEQGLADNVAALTISLQDYKALDGENERKLFKRIIEETIYKCFKDEFHFINLIRNAEENRKFEQPDPARPKNPDNFISQANYGQIGSSNTQLATIFYPSLNNMMYGASLHEIGHTWSNEIVEAEDLYGNPVGKKPAGQRICNDCGHWGVSDANGAVGGFDRTKLQLIGSGQYRYSGEINTQRGNNTIPYSSLELYLMGLESKENIQPLTVYRQASLDSTERGLKPIACTPADCVDIDRVFKRCTDPTMRKAGGKCYKPAGGQFPEKVSGSGRYTLSVIATTFSASPKKYSVEDIEELAFSNVRGFKGTPNSREFRAMNLVLTTQPLTAEQWQKVDRYVRWMSLPASDDQMANELPADDLKKMHNFWEATHGKGAITAEGLSEFLLQPGQSNPAPLPLTQVSVCWEGGPDEHMNYAQKALQELNKNNYRKYQLNWDCNGGGADGYISLYPGLDIFAVVGAVIGRAEIVTNVVDTTCNEQCYKNKLKEVLFEGLHISLYRNE